MGMESSYPQTVVFNYRLRLIYLLMPNPKAAFMILGILAIVYGVVNYLISSMGWETYIGWLAGGVILLLV